MRRHPLAGGNPHPLAFATTLGLVALAVSLAVKDTIADAISGFIILVDRPFRISDRIEIQGVGTWGDVVDIGPVDALYDEMVFRVRWWIESYRDTRRMFDKVHTALQHDLDSAGIDCPFPTQTLNLKMQSEAAEQISQPLQGQKRKPDET